MAETYLLNTWLQIDFMNEKGLGNSLSDQKFVEKKIEELQGFIVEEDKKLQNFKETTYYKENFKENNFENID